MIRLICLACINPEWNLELLIDIDRLESCRSAIGLTAIEAFFTMVRRINNNSIFIFEKFNDFIQYVIIVKGSIIIFSQNLSVRLF